jgi:hypothetical protein
MSQVQLPEPSAGFAQASKNITASSPADSVRHSWFRTIPPERIGLDGEYDHSGLAKRVFRAYQRRFSGIELEGLRVTQRGKVVLLMGKVPNPQLLDQLVDVALEVEGTSDVETQGIRVDRSLPMA